MSEEKDPPDLLDLKFLPAWLKETPGENRYADFAGEEAGPAVARERRGPERRGGDRRDRGPRAPRGKERRDPRERERRPAAGRPEERTRPEMPPPPPAAVDVRFVPDPRVLEAVLAQIKGGHLAYSVFSLSRMFLDKPERYDVVLKAESGTLFQLGDNGPVASDQRVLENGAFLAQKDEFYRTEVTQTEPIKGNFTSIARCRLSGVLLGPPNHHTYQPQLRSLYEQRFSRRMSFPEYQRQIEIVTNPEAVERWKEEARTVTTYVTLKEEPPLTFKTAAETERHFRQTYLPGLLRSSAEARVDGVVSRRLADRSLGRTIEDAWAREFRSPSRMMQELMGAFRQGALHTFRHRKGMLFVSPIRVRPFQHGSSSVSASVAAILSTLGENPGINRNQLFEKQPHDEAEPAEAREKKKLSLASDLHWLISEGHVIEFNDGALDLARVKPPPPVAPAPAAAPNLPNGAVLNALPPEESDPAPAVESSREEAAPERPAEPVAPPASEEPAAEAPAPAKVAQENDAPAPQTPRGLSED
ncbi:MAG TPA: hypothetical protein VH207_16680 [Chthoniobacterales bacterium]|jgi:hypothetical protein|nr:hypothetical protein [Chthoniobacterales bacterium]